MFQRTLDIITEYWKTFVFLIATSVFIYVGIVFEWDKEIMAGFVVLIGILSNAFAGLVGLVALIPFIGPLLIKILSIPIFWLLNAGGYFVSILFVKKGYGSSVVQGRVLTMVLLIGVVIGFILGKLL
ncbi:MAG: hypothetical protein K9M49_00575 [Candidatus Marinimicrobia bacterium]|nr:hypothetical protein [Candidatus Neomarinimicrobiota bacterium]MCF7850644.1 hypothetical protein [Candidatus Neomarinimicrobiota bacterium]MCF7903622.1 hypothetical protein [Candidatus Neomarinimicrobiota bacterium]